MSPSDFDHYLLGVFKDQFPGPFAWLQRLPHILLLAVMAAGVWIAYRGISRIPEHYKAIGRAECRAAAATASASSVVAQAASVATQAHADMSRATTTGAAHEHTRSRIESHYQRLATEARHDPPSPVDSCVLPDVRLRRWIAANDGPNANAAADQSAAASQPDGGTAAAAPAGVWPHARPGDEPSGRRQGLPPARQPALPASGLPGDDAR